MCDKVIFVLALLLLVVSIIVSIKYIRKSTKESYASSCNSYVRLPTGVDSRTNCSMCKGFSNSYDYICPYNCRKYGVATCDQGLIL